MTKSTRDGRTIESDPTEPFKGLCQFVEWWEEFKRVHCEGIQATFTVDANLVVTFSFVHKGSIRRYSLDLKDRYIPKALDEIKIVLHELREAWKVCL
jgi:hypothetical protein